MYKIVVVAFRLRLHAAAALRLSIALNLFSTTSSGKNHDRRLHLDKFAHPTAPTSELEPAAAEEHPAG